MSGVAVQGWGGGGSEAVLWKIVIRSAAEGDGKAVSQRQDNKLCSVAHKALTGHACTKAMAPYGLSCASKGSGMGCVVRKT